MEDKSMNDFEGKFQAHVDQYRHSFSDPGAPPGRVAKWLLDTAGWAYENRIRLEEKLDLMASYTE